MSGDCSMEGLRKPVIDIDLNASVVTSQTVSTIVASILDLLLFDRKQIPFVYNTFKYMVEKLDANSNDEEDWDNYLVEHERKVASDTLSNIKILKRNISAEIDTIDIDRVMILFGPNSLTPREAFEIHLPTVNRDHYDKNHIESDNNLVRNMSISILKEATKFESTPSCNHYLNQSTNVYVLLNPRKPEQYCTDATFQRHDDFQVHPDCQKTVFRLRNNYSNVAATKANCCADLVVYNEMSMLRMSDQISTTETDVRNIDCVEQISNDVTLWFESDVYVKGYKDKQVKGQSIWK